MKSWLTDQRGARTHTHTHTHPQISIQNLTCICSANNFYSMNDLIYRQTAATLRLTRNWTRFHNTHTVLTFNFIVYIFCVCIVHVKYFPISTSKSISPCWKTTLYGAFVPLSHLPHILFWFSNIVIERVRTASVQAPQCWAGELFWSMLGIPVPRVERFSRL